MPELLTFRGRPVKRRKKMADDRLKLVFHTTESGAPGEQLVITQAEWDAHGRSEFFPPGMLPDVRALARSAHA